MRRFNTTGPCLPRYHYMIPALGRLPEAPVLVARMGYFVVHAPRQTGRTTALRALAEELTARGEYAALHLSCEVGEPLGEDIGGAQRGVLDRVRTRAETALPPELRPPPWPEAPGASLWRPDASGPLAEGLAQLDAYLDRLDLYTGVLVVFDRRPAAAPIAERTRFDKATSPTGRPVTLLRA